MNGVYVCIKYQKHSPHNAVQAVDLLVGEGSGWLFLHEEGWAGALWGWSSNRTKTADWVCKNTCYRPQRKKISKRMLCMYYYSSNICACWEFTCVFVEYSPVMDSFLGGGRLRDSINTCCPLVFTMWTSLQICWKVICLKCSKTSIHVIHSVLVNSQRPY